ncbi:hypothetical protein BDN72DRAFT_892460 [Pluteus cervinus]|uniref:Uncharacterized protein n=1 Tax=Pluteus cervinus TaxID=181527 RepID=A0ACD3BB90_9AGAR|nr:hypothetical protein BDN72DRAFT_892460 [Pluteus cervinus]
MSTPAQKLARLEPPQRANFATTARLLSCLVTESLVRALYFPLQGVEATGVAIVLKGNVSSGQPSYSSGDLLAVIPLLHAPVFKHDGTDSKGPEIGLLDPLDMAPLIFEPRDDAIEIGELPEHSDICATIVGILRSPGWAIPEAFRLVSCRDPLSVWERFGKSIDLDPKVIREIGEEYTSAVKWQTYSYQHPPLAPQFTSPSISWEQSIVEGHPTHPMHKSRMFLPPLPDVIPGEFDLYHPKLRFVQVPRDKLKITYQFEALLQPLVEAASQKADRLLQAKDGYVIVPVHELQIHHITPKFPEIVICPEVFTLDLLAQQSIRSLIVPNAYRELSLKLGVGIKLTSAVRTISPASAYLGPRFSAQVVPALTMDHSVITVAKELASVVHAHPDGEIAKHCSAIIREAHENTSEERGERLIVCTSLVESGHSGEGGDIPAVIRVFDLDTEEKRVQWLDKFITVFFAAFLPPVLHNGVAFECHPQNCVARFDLVTKEIRGFIIRDFGGLRVHRETLKDTTGVELDFLEGHSIIAEDLDDVYTRMYHTVFHNHFQQLIRILDLHYNGVGWALVRQRLEEAIPHGHPLRDAWLSPERKTLPGKCFLRMRMSGMYRFHLHGPFPNLIHYKGVEA